MSLQTFDQLTRSESATHLNLPVDELSYTYSGSLKRYLSWSEKEERLKEKQIQKRRGELSTLLKIGISHAEPLEKYEKMYLDLIKKGYQKKDIPIPQKTITNIEIKKIQATNLLKSSGFIPTLVRESAGENLGFAIMSKSDIIVDPDQPINRPSTLSKVPTVSLIKTPEMIVTETSISKEKFPDPIKKTILDEPIAILPSEITNYEVERIKQDACFPGHKQSMFTKNVGKTLAKASVKSGLYYEIPYNMTADDMVKCEPVHAPTGYEKTNIPIIAILIIGILALTFKIVKI